MQAGPVKQVRLVTQKSGRSRGFAYVEFATKEAAEAAVTRFHSTEHEGRALTVALSRPPSASGAQGTTTLVNRRGGVAFVPSAVRKGGVRPLSATADSSGGARPKSQADFRALLGGGGGAV
jgi:RNA recognition motif-containing protein